MKKPKNSITTLSYFCKRLKDNGFITLKLFSNFGKHDPRRWTIIVDPGNSSVLITCYSNKVFSGETVFELYDGGQRFPKNYNLKTESIEVVISYLLRHGICNDSKSSPYYVMPKYLNNERGQKQEKV
jgi:hypothetical protein